MQVSTLWPALAREPTAALTGPRMMLQGQLPRPTDIMSLRIDNGERATLEYADIALSPTRYIASWLRQRGWRLPDYRCLSRTPPLAQLHTHQLRLLLHCYFRPRDPGSGGNGVQKCP